MRLSIIRTQVGSGTPSFRYVLSDNLGSVSSVTDGVGSTPTVEHDSYDPWGKRRNPNGTDATCGTITSQTTRGYTGQEMLDSANVCLVNMNARLYDPGIGRFMAADSIVPDALSTQSYNRYSYIENNPLNATDPSGHVDCDLDPTHCRYSSDGSAYGIECYGCTGAGWTDTGGYIEDTAANNSPPVIVNGQVVQTVRDTWHNMMSPRTIASLPQMVACYGLIVQTHCE